MNGPKGSQIFRAADGSRFSDEMGIMTTDPTPVQAAGLRKLIGAGAGDGFEFTVLCNLPGFTLVNAWVKKDYPLPLHSHSSDCLYYVVAGSARFGTENLEAGDAFFIPSNTPYTYRAGPEGVEVLEFRHTGDVDYRNYSMSKVFYEKALDAVLANREGWRRARRPERRS